MTNRHGGYPADERTPNEVKPPPSSVTNSSSWKWLESTKKLQEEAFGLDYSKLKGDKLADYFVMNHTALVTELTEFMQEVGWKDWAQPRGWVNRDNAIKELVDAAHFLSNLACAIGVTDSEWEQAYQAKQALNRERQVKGYDGITGKCPGCKRSYDDGIPCIPDTGRPPGGIPNWWCSHTSFGRSDAS